MIDDAFLPDVSRETLSDLNAYAEVLLKWNRRINLIGASTVDDLWDRHILDSIDAVQCIENEPDTWLDLGTGAGLPGVVAAILNRDTKIILLESDKRKCEFLRAVRRELGLNLEILANRIETAPPKKATVISARALAPLTDLLKFVERHGTVGTTCVFPKGRSWADEHAVASDTWEYDLDARQVRAESDGRILVIRNLRRKEH